MMWSGAKAAALIGTTIFILEEDEGADSQRTASFRPHLLGKRGSIRNERAKFTNVTYYLNENKLKRAFRMAWLTFILLLNRLMT